VLLPEWTRFTEGYYLLIYAALVMAMMAFCPSGLLGLIERAGKVMTRRAPPPPALRTVGTDPMSRP